ncbi:MAG: hypothetical protein ACP5M0_03385 [Desulfomonilaceae bacterium]
MDDQIILAASENFGNVTVCPGGVVHVNLAHVSLKLLPSEFIKLSDLIAQARIRFEPPTRPGGKPSLQVVGPRAPEDPDNPEK